MKTIYENMEVYANHDKTQCGFDIATDKKFWLTTELEESFDSPVFLQGPVKALASAKDLKIQKLYEEIKDQKYFIILREEWNENNN